MKKLLDAIRTKPKTEVHHGVVLQVSKGDSRVRVILNSGVKMWMRYGTNITNVNVGDKLLIGGDNSRFVIQGVDKSIPKDTNIIIV